MAISDPAGILATPHETLARRWPDGHPDTDDVSEVVALCTERGAVEVVVGLPRTLAGAEGAAAQAARTYAAELARRIAPVGVRLVDERLTSVDAHRALRESGVSGRRQRAVVDQAAAVLILQAALDEERSAGRPPGEPVIHKRRRPKMKDGPR
ncbi:Holliday junction resolvase RuvX [Knoellia aerolata]|uniref:Holliday junction resolvase RuvX n=1 Tax=Knoellia aerolata TaxID=442954 RepID=UPI001FDEA4C3|nr:Holliday junction resolvase RuvX [Knoellia aerolata]